MTGPIVPLRAFCVILIACALTACSGGLQRSDKNAKAPPGLDANGVEVDGFLVGHRLMASGQHELALKSFYRAAAKEGFTVDVLTALGSANLKLGRLGQAEDLYRQAIDKDEKNAAAWNNLGVVLMEQGQMGEAERVFRTAFALDNGSSTQIRENLRLALAKLENPGYDAENNETFDLVPGGNGTYQLVTQP